MTARPLARGSTIGIIGGGQLGRMLAMAAARLGFRTVILEPDVECPAAQVAGRQIVGGYDDLEALEKLASASNVVTYEFENVPVGGLVHLARSVPVFPPPKALEVAQDRLGEKRFLNAAGIATARYREVDSQSGLQEALEEFNGTGILKTRRLGYDGKGQRPFAGPDDSPAGVFAAMGGVPMILEERIAFDLEISVIAARGRDGALACYDPAQNRHSGGILKTSTVPAAITEATALEAIDHAGRLLAALDYVGVIGVEFFVLDDGSLLANEFAPRVHNSGHWSEALCAVSQFENHIRAICGLPLGSTRRHSAGEMTNILGDDISGAAALFCEPDTVVHLYGKAEVRPGRKMGHVTRLRARENHTGS